jgi:hypothetical protein
MAVLLVVVVVVTELRQLVQIRVQVVAVATVIPQGAEMAHPVLW